MNDPENHITVCDTVRNKEVTGMNKFGILPVTTVMSRIKTSYGFNDFPSVHNVII